MMKVINQLSFEEMWQAAVSCNRSYDGQFIYAVKTTNIYCRPSCKSKTPNMSNICFFKNAAEAEKQGFRACKRCQPQLNDPTYDPYSSIIHEMITFIEINYRQKLSLKDLAQEVGVSDYHLNRTFKERVGLTPRQYVEKVRIEEAKKLLLTTNATNTDIGYQVGYESLSSFYRAFHKQAGCSPKEYRQYDQ